MPEVETDDPVVLFDGVCNLCSGAVQFVVEHDPEGRFRFASLQSEVGQELLVEAGLPTDDFDSFVLIEDGEVYTKSAGALRVARHLERPWSLLWTFRFLPRLFRDLGYDLVARYRYAVFGRKDQCLVPTPELRDRFLDGGVGPPE
jgi:predicted DCC family thiol-disulfide oxidoreductase YuxK